MKKHLQFVKSFLLTVVLHLAIYRWFDFLFKDHEGIGSVIFGSLLFTVFLHIFRHIGGKWSKDTEA